MARPLNNLRHLARVPLVNGRIAFILPDKVTGVQDTTDPNETRVELDTGTVLLVAASLEVVVRRLDEFVRRDRAAD